MHDHATTLGASGSFTATGNAAQGNASMSDPTVYDKSKWHYDSDRYPKGLPPENAHTHGGFFLAWAFQRGLVSASFVAEHSDAFDQFKSGRATPGRLMALVGATLASDMFTDTGNEFADDYIEEMYIDDYWLEFEDDYESFYHVEDNPKNFETIVGVLDGVYEGWREDQ